MMRIIIVLYFVLGWAGKPGWFTTVAAGIGSRSRKAAMSEDGSVFFAARGRALLLTYGELDERESADADAYIDFMRTDRICPGRVIAGGI